MSGASILSGGSGNSDWSKYTPFTQLITNNISTANSWYTIMNINGKGYLKKCAMSVQNGYTSTVRITLDGVVIFLSQGNSYVDGSIATIDCFRNEGGTTRLSVFVVSGGRNHNICIYKKSYPYTGGGRGYCMLPQELFFNSSLKIEAQSGSTGINNYFQIEGGNL